MAKAIHRSRAVKVWVRPRLRQLGSIVVCWAAGHSWGEGWRRETEDWYELLEFPEPWAWRCCGHCGLIETVPPE